MASSASFALYGNPVLSSSKPSSGITPLMSPSRNSACAVKVVCQAPSSESDHTNEGAVHLSRRSLAITTSFTTLLGSLGTCELAHAARKKGPDVDTPKPPKEEKDVGGYDAKVRATYRRKEALKEAMAKLKEKSAAKKEVPPLDSIKAKPSPKKEAKEPEVAPIPPKAVEAEVATTTPQETSATTPVVSPVTPSEVAKEAESSSPVAE